MAHDRCFTRITYATAVSIVYYSSALIGAGFKGKSAARANLFRSTENRKSLVESFSPPTYRTRAVWLHYYRRRRFISNKAEFSRSHTYPPARGAHQTARGQRATGATAARTFRKL